MRTLRNFALALTAICISSAATVEAQGIIQIVIGNKCWVGQTLPPAQVCSNSTYVVSTDNQSSAGTGTGTGATTAAAKCFGLSAVQPISSINVGCGSSQTGRFFWTCAGFGKATAITSAFSGIYLAGLVTPGTTGLAEAVASLDCSVPGTNVTGIARARLESPSTATPPDNRNNGHYAELAEYTTTTTANANINLQPGAWARMNAQATVWLTLILT